jgi:hypothetical protein
MYQSMLAILAICILGMMALQQHRNQIHAEQAIIRKEIATQALAIAVDRLEEIGSMDFDENTIDDARLYSSAALTLPDSFIRDSQDNDIDDFHGSSVEKFRVTNDQEVWFEVRTTVVYAEEDNPDQPVASSTEKTKIKKATVEVWPKDTLGINLPGKIQIPDTVRLSQSFACGSWCDW